MCNASFPIREANYGAEDIFDAIKVHCPRCDVHVEDLSYKDVDLARALTLENALFFCIAVVVLAIGTYTATLMYAGPILLGTFGAWLTRAKVRNHRVAGWLLIGLALGVFFLAHLLTV